MFSSFNLFIAVHPIQIRIAAKASSCRVWLRFKPKVYLQPRHAVCLTVAEPPTSIKLARNKSLERTGIGSLSSIRSPSFETSTHFACAYLVRPRSSSQEMRAEPKYGIR